MGVIDDDARSYRMLLEFETGKLIWLLEGPNGKNIKFAIFSPDSRYVLTWGEDSLDDTLRLWQIDTGKMYIIYRAAVRSATFSPDSRYVLYSDKTNNNLMLLEFDWEWEFPEKS